MLPTTYGIEHFGADWVIDPHPNSARVGAHWWSDLLVSANIPILVRETLASPHRRLTTQPAQAVAPSGDHASIVFDLPEDTGHEVKGVSATAAV